MRLEGVIKHGVAMSADNAGEFEIELVCYGGINLHIAGCVSENVAIAFGPIGTYINKNDYYTKTEINGKGYLTQHQDISGKADKATTYTKAEVNEMMSHVHIDMDDAPTEGSSNAVSSGGVFTALSGKVNKQVGKGLSSNDYTDAEKTKLANLAEVATSGDYDDLNNKPTIPTVPSNVSAFVNDAGYLTEHQSLGNYYTKTEVNSALGNKQDTLISGTNIKSINGTSVLGGGNITIPSGADGKSAYQSYVDTTTDVPVKTETEWVASLKGEDGEPGAQGPQGPAGADGQDGADGVDLGEVALVQTTGDATDKVMSQNAVTEYGRKVTAEDLDGTSDWIKAKLTAEGWEENKAVLNGGGTSSYTGYWASHYIPVSDLEGKQLSIYGGEFTSSTYCICMYDANKTKLAYWAFTTKPRTFTVGTYSSTIAYIRMTCKTANIGNCYILNSITSEYIFKAEEYFTSIFKQNNLVVDANFLEDTIIKQEKGQSAIKTMSQKAITDAINFNTSIERGTSVQMNGTLYTRLTQEQVTTLNNSDVMSIRFMIYGSDTGNGGQDWRYVVLGSTGTAADVFRIRMHFSGAIILGSDVDSSLTYAIAGQPSNPEHPIIATIVWDKKRGIVSYYKFNTLITTETNDRYKITNFIDSSGIIIFTGGDQNARFYGVQFYDCDLKKYCSRTDVNANEWYADRSEVVKIFQNYETHSFSPVNVPQLYSNGDYNRALNTEDNSYTITRKSGTAGRFWLTNYGPSWSYLYSYTFTIDKPFKLIANYGNKSTIYDMEDNIVAQSTDGTTIPAGNYKLEIYWNQQACGIETTEDGAILTLHTYTRRLVGCIAHFDFSTLYNGKIYDNVSNQFYTLYSNATCTTVSTQHTLSQLPLRGVYIGNLTKPHYIGEIILTGGKAYIANNEYTWKQINNS